MTITDGERLIIAMLADIMEAQNSSNHELDPKLIRTLVCNKEDWALKWQYSGIFEGSPRDESIAKETRDILWMWGIIEHSISKLSGTEATEASTWHYNKFHGFDANHDDHYGVALTLINELGHHNEFKGRYLNSHSQTSLPRYREMYSKFDGYLSGLGGKPLGFDALKDLCS